MDWKAELHKELADATQVVWQMQNGLSEGTMPLAALVELAMQLNRRSGIIQGHLARWALRDREEQSKTRCG